MGQVGKLAGKRKAERAAKKKADADEAARRRKAEADEAARKKREADEEVLSAFLFPPPPHRLASSFFWVRMRVWVVKDEGRDEVGEG